MSHTQPSPTGGVTPHHGHIAAHPQVNGHIPMPAQGQKGPPLNTAQKIAALNEQVWLQIGSLTELMGDLEGAMNAYEQALRHNQWSIPAMNAISCILRTKEQFPKAIEYLQNILKLDPTSGETWGSLGHCHLMMDNLQEAYTSYQQALYHLRDPKEPKLWYGIGILYDRYGSLDHAEEAFSQVMRMAPDFEKANEIYFRLGIIYKQQQKFNQSLECFKYIVTDPPRPLTEEDIWFQIGHVHEQQKDFDSAQQAYRRVLDRDPNHAKVLQQLGWLYHQQSNSYASQEKAIEYLEKSVSADNTDAQSWYLLGRCYMSQAKYPKAYEAYQQAVYRDGRNPTFWCSIGVLYYQINQYRDALDAYSRAIRLNPYISEVWYDLGTLYESCNNQIADALDAYGRAADLDPSNVHIKARLQLLQSQMSGSNQNNAPAPQPQDVHPQAYQAPGVGGPPAPQWGAPAPTGGPPPQPPAPPRQIADWNRGINELQSQAQPQAQGPNGFDHRDAVRASVTAIQQPSPRQEPGRAFPEGVRAQPNVRSPKVSGLPGPAVYPPPHGLPQLSNPPAPSHDRSHSGPTPFGSGPRGALPPAPTGPPPAPGAPNGAPGSAGPLPPYHRPFTPPTEIRPIRDERPSSPGSTYPHQQYHHGPSVPPVQVPGSTGIASGAPAPASAITAAEAAAREREERPASAMKRAREWEADAGPTKKIANEESRARLDDQMSRRVTPPNRMPSPATLQRRNSSEGRREEHRPDENYHPSEAAHHPPTLPSIQNMPPHASGSSLPPMTESPVAPSSGPQPGIPSTQVPVKEEPRAGEQTPVHEPAARKMDVDEDYDDDADDEKRTTTAAKGSPSASGSTNANNGSNGGLNGNSQTPQKQESTT
ncbi:glucose repression mediator protein [Aspergillus nanangensis]|uniref:Glucose repression mediator protein n=1 Tax=Aspergillus nanangensis TaxID=2582783 RepID=A0AAD4CWK0_ASPNN|nr:glucose repression mediator protein [Aspergillus nanangensis]